MTLMHGIGGDETPASPVIQIKKNISLPEAYPLVLYSAVGITSGLHINAP